MDKNKDPLAVELGKRGGKAKNAKLSPDERKKIMAKVRSHIGGYPQKEYRLKTPCTFPHCRVTIPHEHI